MYKFGSKTLENRLAKVEIKCPFVAGKSIIDNPLVANKISVLRGVSQKLNHQS